MNPTDLLKLLENNWSALGSCNSCGWHALFHEHNIDEAEVQDALDNSAGNLMVSCVSKDADDPWSHRGIRVNLYELAKEYPNAN